MIKIRVAIRFSWRD